MSESGFIYKSTLTDSFKALKNRPYINKRSFNNLKAVVIGGGTGAPVSIRTLLSMGIQTSAVVAMADDGGSTGILRQEAHVSPPGDVRKCLAAFAQNSDDPLTKAFKYRFEFARNHTLGNLMLSALEQATGSFPEAIKICGELLHARGRVYPSTLNNVTLCAKTLDGVVLQGQANACKSKTALEKVWLESPEDCYSYEAAIEAIKNADLIVLGPGSLFTSIIPNLLVPGIVEAIKESRAKTLFICSIADQQGETWGLSAREHIEALYRHGMDGILDFVIIHSYDRPRGYHVSNNISLNNDKNDQDFQNDKLEMKSGSKKKKIRPVKINTEDVKEIRKHGTIVLLRDMVDPHRPTWHDPAALERAIEGVIYLCRSQMK